MPAPISNAKRQQIVALFATNKSCNTIATEVGVSSSTVSKIAGQEGHRFGQSSATRAQEIRSAYGAERRAATMARFHEEADRLLAQMTESHVAFNFGGKDNTYNEHEMESPPVDAKRALMQAAREAMRTVLDIDKHDNREEHMEAKGLIIQVVEALRPPETKEET